MNKLLWLCWIILALLAWPARPALAQSGCTQTGSSASAPISAQLYSVYGWTVGTGIQLLAVSGSGVFTMTTNSGGSAVFYSLSVGQYVPNYTGTRNRISLTGDLTIVACTESSSAMQSAGYVVAATATATPTPTATPTSGPTNTPEPTSGPTNTPEPTSGPTNTPEPTSGPTNTPEPTSTPIPTPTYWPTPVALADTNMPETMQTIMTTIAETGSPGITMLGLIGLIGAFELLWIFIVRRRS